MVPCAPITDFNKKSFPAVFLILKNAKFASIFSIELDLWCKIASIRSKMYHLCYLLWSVEMQILSGVNSACLLTHLKDCCRLLCGRFSVRRRGVISTTGSMSELIGRHRPPFLPFLVFPQDKAADENKKCWNGPTSRGINQRELPIFAQPASQRWRSTKDCNTLKKRLHAGWLVGTLLHWGHEWSRWSWT